MGCDVLHWSLHSMYSWGHRYQHRRVIQSEIQTSQKVYPLSTNGENNLDIDIVLTRTLEALCC